MSDIVQSILAGHLDDDLSDILDAIKAREDEGKIEVLWRVAWDGLDITAENLTVAEARTVETMLRQPIHTFNPALSATNVATVAAARLIAGGMTPEAAFEEIGKVPARDLARAVTVYTVIDPPKDGSPPETPPT